MWKLSVFVFSTLTYFLRSEYIHTSIQALESRGKSLNLLSSHSWPWNLLRRPRELFLLPLSREQKFEKVCRTRNSVRTSFIEERWPFAPQDGAECSRSLDCFFWLLYSHRTFLGFLLLFRPGENYFSDLTILPPTFSLDPVTVGKITNLYCPARDALRCSP